MICLLTAVGLTVMVAVAVSSPADAVIVSVIEEVPEAQPLSVYVAVAIPAELVTGLESVALPLETQGEVKVTEMGTVAAAPSTSTGTVTLLVPYAEIGDVPMVIAPSAISAPPTVIPKGALVVVTVASWKVTGADAVMLMAPAESMSAAFKVIVASPSSLVNAVAAAGVNATRRRIGSREGYYRIGCPFSGCVC